jgi:hypothetical protein
MFIDSKFQIFAASERRRRAGYMCEALDVVHLVPLLYTLHITEADSMATTKKK